MPSSPDSNGTNAIQASWEIPKLGKLRTSKKAESRARPKSLRTVGCLFAGITSNFGGVYPLPCLHYHSLVPQLFKRQNSIRNLHTRRKSIRQAILETEIYGLNIVFKRNYAIADARQAQNKRIQRRQGGNSLLLSVALKSVAKGSLLPFGS